MMIQEDLLKVIFNLTEYGSITIQTPEKKALTFKGKKAGPNAKITLNTWKALDALITHKDLGLFEAYVENLWDTDDLKTLCDFLFQNEKALEKLDESYVMSQLGLGNSLTLWAQSSTVKFSDKKPLSEYSFTFDYGLPKESKKERVLVLGKNNAHLKDLSNVTIFQHNTDYEPFDTILAYDPFFYPKDADVFLKVISKFIKTGGKFRWRTFVFDDDRLTQGTFISKLVYPGYWTPRAKELEVKANAFFKVKTSENADFPELPSDDRLVEIFGAIAGLLIKSKKIRYEEWVLVRN